MMALPSPCQFRFFAVGRHTLAATQSVDLRLKFNQIWFEQGLSNQNWSFINDMPYPSLVNRFRKLYTFKLHFLLFFLIWGGRNSISPLKIRVRRLYKSICKKKIECEKNRYFKLYDSQSKPISLDVSFSVKFKSQFVIFIRSEKSMCCIHSINLL